MNEAIKQGYEDLANAIILQAVNDYRGLLTGSKPTATVNVPEVELFFKSEWFGLLTKVDGIKLMTEIKKECGQCV